MVEFFDCVFRVLSEVIVGRPGGGYLDFPADVLHQRILGTEADELLDSAEEKFKVKVSNGVEKLDKVVGNGVEGLSEGVKEAVAMLRQAERLLIVFGKGASYSRAGDEFNNLVERTRIPFLPTPMGKGLISDTHELAATAARSLAIGKYDVALFVGARLNCQLHFGEPPKWSKDVTFILVNVSEEEIELRKPHLGLVGDAKRVVGLLNEEIKDDPFCLGRSHPWVESTSNKAKENVAMMEAQLVKDVVPFNFLTPMRFIRDAITTLGSPAPIIVSDGANTMDVGRSVLVQTEPRTLLDAGTWGTMGVGLGYCIAAAVASPERLVGSVQASRGCHRIQQQRCLRRWIDCQ